MRDAFRRNDNMLLRRREGGGGENHIIFYNKRHWGVPSSSSSSSSSWGETKEMPFLRSGRTTDPGGRVGGKVSPAPPLPPPPRVRAIVCAAKEMGGSPCDLLFGCKNCVQNLYVSKFHCTSTYCIFLGGSHDPPSLLNASVLSWCPGQSIYWAIKVCSSNFREGGGRGGICFAASMLAGAGNCDNERARTKAEKEEKEKRGNKRSPHKFKLKGRKCAKGDADQFQLTIWVLLLWPKKMGK